MFSSSTYHKYFVFEMNIHMGWWWACLKGNFVLSVFVCRFNVYTVQAMRDLEKQNLIFVFGENKTYLSKGPCIKYVRTEGGGRGIF